MCNTTNVIVECCVIRSLSQACSEEKNPSFSNRSQTYNLPTTSSGSVPLSYRRLVGAKPFNYFHVTNLRRVGHPRKFGWVASRAIILQSGWIPMTQRQNECACSSPVSNLTRQNGGIFKIPIVCFRFAWISPNQNR